MVHCMAASCSVTERSVAAQPGRSQHVQTCQHSYGHQCRHNTRKVLQNAWSRPNLTVASVYGATYSLTTLKRRAHSRRPLSGCRPVRALFTGIVQGVAKVVAVDKKDDFSSIRIQFPDGKADGVQIGASVAINGTCLTVVEIESDTLSFDIIVETLRATSLGSLQPGSAVNFERSARMGDEIGGHHVSGHVHTTARVLRREETENNVRLMFGVGAEWTKYILPKGFIAVDGCSLTVGEVGADWFSVYLIPETLRMTVFGTKAEGDAVNIEIEAQTQAIVDTVQKVVARYLDKSELFAKA